MDGTWDYNANQSKSKTKENILFHGKPKYEGREGRRKGGGGREEGQVSLGNKKADFGKWRRGLEEERGKGKGNKGIKNDQDMLPACTISQNEHHYFILEKHTNLF